MQLPSILSFAVLAATTVHARCYAEKGIDEAYWQKGDARARAKEACAGVFAGSYSGSGTDGGHRSTCVAAMPPPPNYGDRTQHYVFEVSHVGDGDRVIKTSECEDGLIKEINGCDYGGDSSYTNWRYK